jgi:hypothetical protein
MLNAEFPLDINRQALPSVFIDHTQQPESSTIMRPAMYEVLAPDIVSILWTQPATRTFIESQTMTFRLFRRDFQTFSPPQSGDPFDIHEPAIPTQQGSDLAEFGNDLLWCVSFCRHTLKITVQLQACHV